jgi:hypothetical protein
VTDHDRPVQPQGGDDIENIFAQASDVVAVPRVRRNTEPAPCDRVDRSEGSGRARCRRRREPYCPCRPARRSGGPYRRSSGPRAAHLRPPSRIGPRAEQGQLGSPAARRAD